jgi:hypothetical protein
VSRIVCSSRIGRNEVAPTEAGEITGILNSPEARKLEVMASIGLLEITSGLRVIRSESEKSVSRTSSPRSNFGSDQTRFPFAEQGQSGREGDLFVAQRHDWVNEHSAACRNVARQKRN